MRVKPLTFFPPDNAISVNPARNYKMKPYTQTECLKIFKKMFKDNLSQLSLARSSFMKRYLMGKLVGLCEFNMRIKYISPDEYRAHIELINMTADNDISVNDIKRIYTL